MANLKGGTVIYGNATVNGSLNAAAVIVNGLQLQTSSTFAGGTINQILIVNTSTSSTSITSGALVVTGGVGVGGTLYVGGTVTASNAFITGSPTVGGGMYVGGTVTASNAFITGAPTVGYYTAIGPALYLGNNAGSYPGGQIFINYNSLALVSATSGVDTYVSTNATGASPTTGIKVKGSTGDVIILNASSSISTTTGALQVAGGVGVGGNIWVGGGVNASSSLITGGVINTPYQISSPKGLSHLGTGSLALISSFNPGNAPGSLTIDPTGRFFYHMNNALANTGTISQYTINPVTGVLTTITNNILTGGQPAPITMDPLGRFVFAPTSYTGTVVTFLINTSTGALSTVSSISTVTFTRTDGMAVEPLGRYAFVYGGANAMVSYSIQSNGVLTNPVVTSGLPGYVTSLLTDPTGNFVYAFDTNNLRSYSINQITGSLSFISTTPNINGAANFNAPCIDPSGRFIYGSWTGGFQLFLSNPLTGVVTSSTIYSIPSSLTNPVVDPTGHYLYISGALTIVYTYLINQITGQLTTVTSVASISNPANNTIDPSGRFYYATNGFNGGGINHYAINNFSAGSGIFAGNLNVNGYTLIGYTSSNGSYPLQVNGQIYATNATIATSDAQFKTNVQTLTNALSLVNSFNPVTFDWIPDDTHNFDTSTTYVGFVAQDLLAILNSTSYVNSIIKSSASTNEDGSTNEVLGLASTQLIPLLTKAIQELSSQVTGLQAQVSALTTPTQG